jgi:hypothetical protein
LVQAQHCSNVTRDVFLNGGHILDREIERVGPKHIPAGCLHKAGRDAHPVSGLLDAALQQNAGSGSIDDTQTSISRQSLRESGGERSAGGLARERNDSHGEKVRPGSVLDEAGADKKHAHRGENKGRDERDGHPAGSFPGLKLRRRRAMCRFHGDLVDCTVSRELAVFGRLLQ